MLGRSWSLSELATAVSGSVDEKFAAVQFGGVTTDSRAVAEGDLFVALRGENFDGHAYAQAALNAGASAAMIEQDGVSGPFVRVDDSLRGLGAFASAVLRDRAIETVGITGSCGKTTAKELTAAVLSALRPTGATQGNFNNEIGVPLSVFGLPEPCEVAVLELAMNAPGEIGRLSEMVQPRVGVITCVAPVHLEGVGSLEGVRDAKAEILQGMSESSTLVLNADDPTTPIIRKRFAGQVVTFGFGESADVRATDVRFDSDFHSRFTVSDSHEVELAIYGEAGVTNALVAWSVGEVLDVPAPKMISALSTVEPLPMRMHPVYHGGVTFIHDAYNANPRSMASSLATLMRAPSEGRRIAVLGDMLELGDAAKAEHTSLGAGLAEAGVDLAYVMGEYAELVREGAVAAGLQGEKVYALDSHEAIVDSLRYIVKPGDVVLVKGSRGLEMERVVDGLAEVL